MKSIILAAGKGTRLKELTKSTPKCLVKIQGKSIIEYQLEIFENFKNSIQQICFTHFTVL